MIKLLFTRNDYNNLAYQIKRREVFDREFKFKEFRLRVNLTYFDYEIWKDGMYVRVNINSKYSEFCQGFQLDEFPAYEEFCDKINEYINEDKDEDIQNNDFNQMTIDYFLEGEEK